MLKSVEGVYKHGKIELVELPLDVSESRVIVTFLEPETTRKQTQMMQFGMFSGKNQSTEEDFKNVQLLTCDQNIIASGLVTIVW
jgi:glucan biosynthesis protein